MGKRIGRRFVIASVSGDDELYGLVCRALDDGPAREARRLVPTSWLGPLLRRGAVSAVPREVVVEHVADVFDVADEEPGGGVRVAPAAQL